MPDLEWYEVVNTTNILQGDIIRNLPIIIPSSSVTVDDIKKDEVKLDVIESDVVIMSQSCDLEQGKIKFVLVSQIFPLTKFADSNTYYQSDENKEYLRRGLSPAFHLLNRIDISGFESEILVVSFRDTFTVPIKFLENYCQTLGNRIRLNSPYREHLSQAFARFFMRVGLPVNIPKFV